MLRKVLFSVVALVSLAMVGVPSAQAHGHRHYYHGHGHHYHHHHHGYGYYPSYRAVHHYYGGPGYYGGNGVSYYNTSRGGSGFGISIGF